MNNDGYILLVEDEPMIQAKNKKILQRHGYSIRHAFTIAEAWAAIKEEPPRAIILDIQLPDGSGLDFLQELRKNSNIPVLLLTAMETAQDIVLGLEAGGDDYLTKPYELPLFLARVKALMRRAYLIPDRVEIPDDFFADFTRRILTLTPVEKIILKSCINAAPDKEIMSALYITNEALRKHYERIYYKLGVSGNEELMLYIRLIKMSGQDCLKWE